MIKLFNLNCKQNKTNVRLARSMKPFEYLVRKYYKKSLVEEFKLRTLNEENILEANIYDTTTSL